MIFKRIHYAAAPSSKSTVFPTTEGYKKVTLFPVLSYLRCGKLKPPRSLPGFALLDFSGDFCAVP